MKTWLLGAACLLSFSALAQQNNVAVRIENRLERLNELVQREGAHRSLDQATQQDVLARINQAIQLIRLDAPNPQPPIPQPPIPQPQPNIVAVGKIENATFRFEAPTTGLLFNQCSDFVRTRFSQADDLRVSFNGNAFIFQTTGGWWVGPDAICDVIYRLATPANLAPGRAIGQTYVEGYVEGKRLEITGLTFGEVYNKCVAFVESNFTQVDDMEISVNGSRRERYTTGGWWVGPKAACDVLTQKVPR